MRKINKIHMGLDVHKDNVSDHGILSLMTGIYVGWAEQSEAQQY